MQHREKLGRVADMAAQRAGANVGLFDLRGRIAPGRHHSRPERQLQFQLALDALSGVGRSLKQF